MTFFAWQCGLDETELGRVIANRPETALLAEPPRDHADASRLQSDACVGVMVTASGGQSTIAALVNHSISSRPWVG